MRFVACVILGLMLPVAAHGAGARDAGPEAHATRPLEPPPEAVRLHATYFGRVVPSVRFWIGLQAKKAAQAPPGAAAEASLASAVRARFAGQRMGADDVNVLVALVLMQASKQTEQDLKALAEKQKATLEAKKQLRELQDELAKQVADAAGQDDSARCVPPKCGGLGLATVSAAVRQTSTRVALTSREPMTLGELRAVADEVKDRLDSLSELGETESLRLQMAMDRRSAFVSTLSDLMKKVPDTSHSIVDSLE